MKKKFNIMTDSCCDLPFNYLKENQVGFVSMIVNIENKEYVDDLGEKFDYEWFMEEVKQGKMPSTSQINVGTYYEKFKKYAEEELPMIYVCFSSGLSGSYNNALTALEMLKGEQQNVLITIIDSQAACLGEGLLVYELIQKRDSGCSFEEGVAWLEESKGKLHSWVTVEDLHHLERGGRISKAAATVGGLMNVKPIIVMNKEGKLINVGKVRGRKHSLEKIVDETLKTIRNPEEQTLFVAYAGDKGAGEKVKEMLQNKIEVKDVQLFSMGPTISSHTGYGGMAIFSFGEER